MPEGKKEHSKKDIGEKRALFEEEALPHLDALYNLAFHLTHNESRAQDLVQDAVLRAYRFFHLYQPGTNCKAWMFKILRNTFINEYRRLSRLPRQVDVDEVESFTPSGFTESPLGGPGGENRSKPPQQLKGGDSARLDYLGDEITQALAEIPEVFREAVILADLEDLTYQEITDVMDVPIGTVRSRISRGRGLLRKKLYEFAKKTGMLSVKG